MNEETKEYFNEIKTIWFTCIFGFSLYFLLLPLLVLLSRFSPWLTMSLNVLMILYMLYIGYIIKIHLYHSKRKEYYRLKNLRNPEDENEMDELEEYFSNPDLQGKYCAPWKFFQIYVKEIFDGIFYGEMVPGTIYALRLDLIQKNLINLRKIFCWKKNEKFNFKLLPSEIKVRFMALQIPYERYKFNQALLPRNSSSTALIVDNLELHFGNNPFFYSKWFYLRYLNHHNNNKNTLIIDLPWHSIKNMFEYFLAPFNDKFILTFIAKIDQNQNYLKKIIPINSIILSSMFADSLLSTLKLCNVFSIKKLEIIESELSEADLKVLKTLKLQNLLLNLSLCEDYEIIDSILEAVNGIPDIQ